MQLDTFSEFFVDHTGADAVARPIVQPGYAPQQAFSGITLRALSGNTKTVFVGRSNVSIDSGFALPAGARIFLPVSTPQDVYVIADPAGNSSQTVTITDGSAGDTFTITDGSDPIAYDATAATVQTALEDVFGAGNVSVSGDAGGPWTVAFTGELAKTDVPAMVGVGTGCTVAVVATQASAGSIVSWLVV